MQTDTFYHIYNRANGNEKMFRSVDNYRYFLQQFKKYIVPIADVYAYCLIPNHFHFVVKIKEEEELEAYFKAKLKEEDLTGFENLSGLLISKQFSNFFNSYTKAFNKQHQRNGSLFQRAFKKKIISETIYLQQLILYVHLNPVKHNVNADFERFPHSSYKSILSDKSTLLLRKAVIDLFDDMDNYVFVHQQQQIKITLISDLILEEEE